MNECKFEKCKNANMHTFCLIFAVHIHSELSYLSQAVVPFKKPHILRNVCIYRTIMSGCILLRYLNNSKEKYNEE